MSLDQRRQTISLIGQARTAGARLAPACETVEIDPATYRRWQRNGEVVSDLRATAKRPVPSNKLSVKEREVILDTCHLPECKPAAKDRIYGVVVY